MKWSVTYLRLREQQALAYVNSFLNRHVWLSAGIHSMRCPVTRTQHPWFNRDSIKAESIHLSRLYPRFDWQASHKRMIQYSTCMAVVNGLVIVYLRDWLVTYWLWTGLSVMGFMCQTRNQTISVNPNLILILRCTRPQPMQPSSLQHQHVVRYAVLQGCSVTMTMVSIVCSQTSSITRN